ncbi:hypothetical protein [Caballeronia cordobensis]|uniref:hypothetical protein n=1 Tax=Caballeronia cordobensis TaxID=1353886 RepID=UPI0006AD835D|nr:hypothetical protein [Caballeronia cordobensis]
MHPRIPADDDLAHRIHRLDARDHAANDAARDLKALVVTVGAVHAIDAAGEALRRQLVGHFVKRVLPHADDLMSVRIGSLIGACFVAEAAHRLQKH